jgi:general secretion pathway protein H
MAKKAEAMRTPTFVTSALPNGMESCRRKGFAPIQHVGACPEAGFTLVELVAVLTVIAIAASAIFYSSTRSVATAEFRSILVRAQAGMIESRTSAIAGAREVEVIIDAANRRLAFPGETIALPETVDLEARLAESTRNADGAYAIIFYPDGTSSGGTIDLSFRGRVFQLRINWLTGIVSTHET